MSHVALSHLNDADRQQFVSVCGPLFEQSPWVAERAWQKRPFASLASLHAELVTVMERASMEEKIGLIRGHPDLVGRLAGQEQLSAASVREQAAAGLDTVSPQEAARFRAYNSDYHEKFGFPFVICARENRKDAILEAFPRRLEQSRDQEIATALAEVAKIVWLRLRDAVTEE